MLAIAIAWRAGRRDTVDAFTLNVLTARGVVQALFAAACAHIPWGRSGYL